MPLINFSGLASGIDSEALIEATSDAARQGRVEPKEDQVAELEETNSILEELKTQLITFQSTVRDFSTITGGILAKQASSSNAGVADAVASSSANNGAYALTVTQLAKNETMSFQSSAGTYTSSSDVISASADGSVNSHVVFTIGSPSVETVDITVSATTTLSDFVSTFNNSSSYATANVVNVGTAASPDYRVVVTSNNEGVAEGAISVAVGSVLTGANAFNTVTEDDAQNAQFSLTGVAGTITRSSNTIGDLIPGVTFSLYATGSATVQISDDVESTKSKVEDFIEKFNELINFIADNNQITQEQDGEDIQSIFGPLASTRVDDGILTSLRSNMTGAAYGSGSAVKIFADLGITTERDGTLKFDGEKFEEAMAEPESVEQIFKNFADAASLTNGTIDSYVRFNGLIDVTLNGNKSLIENLNDQIARAEASIARNEETLRARFARLESLIGGLQQQQSALSSAIASLGAG